MSPIRSAFVLTSALLIVTAVPALEPTPIVLVQSVPKLVNSVAVVNVAKLLASPRAMKDGWSKLNHIEYLAGAVPVHPSVERILLAKELNPQAPTTGGITAIIPLKKDADLKKFATTFGGELTTIAESEVVIGKHGAYTAALQPRILGSMTTTNRQEVARWLRYIKDKPTKSMQPEYINMALAVDGTEHHIFVVVDTEELFDERHATLAVSLSEVLKGKLKESEAIEKYFKGLRGLQFGASITPDGITVQLQLDGKAKPQVDSALLKAFVIELFDRNGAHLEDLPAAGVKYMEYGAVRFTFKLTDSELANIMALFLPPLPGVSNSDDISITPKSPPTASTSGRYFRAVNTIIDDLKKQNGRATNVPATALWHDTAAGRMETLSILAVDPELVDYAQGTASRLRAVADSLRGQAISTATLQSKAYIITYTPPPVSWVPGHGIAFDPGRSYYGSSVQSNVAQVRQAILETAKKDSDNRGQLWSSIDRQRSIVQNDMAKKYGIDFESNRK